VSLRARSLLSSSLALALLARVSAVCRAQLTFHFSYSFFLPLALLCFIVGNDYNLIWQLKDFCTLWVCLDAACLLRSLPSVEKASERFELAAREEGKSCEMPCHKHYTHFQSRGAFREHENKPENGQRLKRKVKREARWMLFLTISAGSLGVAILQFAAVPETMMMVGLLAGLCWFMSFSPQSNSPLLLLLLLLNPELCKSEVRAVGFKSYCAIRHAIIRRISLFNVQSAGGIALLTFRGWNWDEFGIWMQMKWVLCG
jgi:hypothetical protein